MKKNLVRKRIAFFHELDKGGARRSSNEFSRQLLKEFQVDLFIIDEKLNPEEKEYYSSVKFYKFIPKIWKGKNWKTRLYKDTVELVKLYFVHKSIAEKINRGGYDAAFVLPSKYTQAPFILRFLKIPTVYYCQEPLRMVYEDLFKVGREVGIGRYYYEKVNRLLRKIIDRQNIQKAGIVLSNSNYTGRNIKARYGLLSKTVYMGVDTSFFTPSKVTKKIYDILYIGAYEKSENFEFLRTTLEKMKYPQSKVRLLLKEKEWITKNTQMRSLYRSAKVLVCLGYKEPFGLMPIEAMACGLPVVALNDGGYKESVINQETGFLIKKNTDELGKALKTVLAKSNYLRMSKSARIASKEWSWVKSGRALSEIIKEACVT